MLFALSLIGNEDVVFSLLMVSISMLNMYRHEFYQKPEEVVVTIFAKGVPASSVDIEFGEQIVHFCCSTSFA